MQKIHTTQNIRKLIEKSPQTKKNPSKREFNFNCVYFSSFLFVGNISPVWKPRDMINLNDAQSTTRNKDDK